MSEKQLPAWVTQQGTGHGAMLKRIIGGRHDYEDLKKYDPEMLRRETIEVILDCIGKISISGSENTR